MLRRGLRGERERGMAQLGYISSAPSALYSSSTAVTSLPFLRPPSFLTADCNKLERLTGVVPSPLKLLDRTEARDRVGEARPSPAVELLTLAVLGCDAEDVLRAPSDSSLAACAETDSRLAAEADPRGVAGGGEAAWTLACERVVECFESDPVDEACRRRAEEGS